MAKAGLCLALADVQVYLKKKASRHLPAPRLRS